jgi:integrase
VTCRWSNKVNPYIPPAFANYLRHTHATHLLTNGIHPKVTSERLGHSIVGITLDLYSRVLPGTQENAAVKVDAALMAARSKP